MFFNFFKTPTIHQYEHLNIYYDPDAEARKERRERIRQELDEKNGIQHLHQRHNLRKGFLTEQRKDNSAEKSSRKIRLCVMICITFALVYWVFK